MIALPNRSARLVAAVLLTGMSAVPPPAGAEVSVQAGAADPVVIGRMALAERSREFLDRVRRGVFSPAKAVAAAARAGDFRTVFAAGFFVQTNPLGLKCDAPAPPEKDERAQVFVSDVAPSSAQDPAWFLTRKALAQGRAYNVALAAQPSFPFADICRPVGDARRASVELRQPDTFPGPPRELMVHTADLSQAARSGSLSEVRRWLALGPPDEPETFGLTPLAWALLRQREDVAALLVGAGADPLGGPAMSVDLAEAPLMIAIRRGRDGLARGLLSRTPHDRLRDAGRALMSAAVDADTPETLTALLAARLAIVDGRVLLDQARKRGSVKALAVLEEREARLCWRAATPEKTRVALIGVYSPSLHPSPGRGAADPPLSGVITVQVEASNVPTLLVLASYEAVTWRLTPASGAHLVGVLVETLSVAQVLGAPPGVPVVVNSPGERCSTYSTPTLAYERSPDLQRLIMATETITRRPVAVFQGDYRGSAYVVQMREGAEPIALPVFSVRTPIDAIRNSRKTDDQMLEALSERDPGADALGALDKGDGRLIFENVRHDRALENRLVGLTCKDFHGTGVESQELTTLGPATPWRGDLRSDAVEAALRRYARLYNRRVAADPRSRLADRCRPAD